MIPDSARRTADLPFRASLLLMVLVLIGAAYIQLHDLVNTPPGVPSDANSLADGLRISRGIPFPGEFSREAQPIFRFFMGWWFVAVGPSQFTGQVLTAFMVVLMVACSYRATWLLLKDQTWRRFGAIVAAGALASISVMLFLPRMLYHVILTPLIVAPTVIALLVACQKDRPRNWFLAGVLASTGPHTYMAGLLTPFWLIGLLAHRLIFGLKGKRLAWRNGLSAIAGMLPLGAVFLWMYLSIPNWLFRATEVSSGSITLLQALTRFFDAFQSYFFQGHAIWRFAFNLPYAPALNVLLVPLALIGLGLTLWNWRRYTGAILIGGLILFTLPSAFSDDTRFINRQIGAMPLLALLAGWGSAWVARQIGLLTRVFRQLPPRTVQQVQRVVLAAILVLMAISMVQVDVNFQAIFADPAHYADLPHPDNWLTMQHLFTTAFIESMQWLAQTDQPTYVSTWVLDNTHAMFYLQREAYPNVTTWARYGLKELPAGQYFNPTYWYFHMPVQDQTPLRALLLPKEKTIVILPGEGLPAAITGPGPGQGSSPYTQDIKDKRGWSIAKLRPVRREELADWTPPPIPKPDDPLPTVGKGLRLLVRHPATSIEPGQSAKVLLDWVVSAPQPADLFGVAQLIDSNMNAPAGTDGLDQYIFSYLYPSARWQPGDIVPNLHVFKVPSGLPEGVYRWGAGVYVPPGQARLKVTAPAQAQDGGPQLANLCLWGALRLPPAKIGTPLPEGATRSKAMLGSAIALEGYQIGRESGQWTVTLYWRANAAPGGDYHIFVHGEREGKVITQHDAQPTVPTWAWANGELFTTVHTLTLPPDGIVPQNIYVGLYEYPSLQRLNVTQDGQNREDRRVHLWAADK